MTIEFVPMALQLSWKGQPWLWFGLPMLHLCPTVTAWIEKGMTDL